MTYSYWWYSLYRTLRFTVRLRFLLLFSLAPLSLTMQNSCSFLANHTCDYFSHSVRDSQNHNSLLCHLKFWKCKLRDYGYCCIVTQPVTLCTSTLKRISIYLVTAYKKREKPVTGRGRYIDWGIIVCRYMYTIHAMRYVQ